MKSLLDQIFEAAEAIANRERPPLDYIRVTPDQLESLRRSAAAAVPLFKLDSPPVPFDLMGVPIVIARSADDERRILGGQIGMALDK